MSKSYIKNILYKNEKGYTLAIVLMVMLVFSVLGMSVMAMSMNSVKMSAGEREDQSVYYIAEAALNNEMGVIEKKINAAYENNKTENAFFNDVLAAIAKTNVTSSVKFEQTAGHMPEATITVKELNKTNPREYKLTSTGFIDNHHRVVEQEFSVEWKAGKNNAGALEGVAFLVRQTATLNSARISGDIATVNTNNSSIEIKDGGITGFDYQSYKGRIYVPSNHSGNPVIKPSWMNNIPNPIKKDFGAIPSLPPFPEFPNHPKVDNFSSIYEKNDGGSSTLQLKKNGSMTKINIAGSHKFTIDVGDTDKELVLGELSLGGGGGIIIKGKGKLRIYVNEKLDLSQGIFNPVSSSEKLDDKFNHEKNSEHLKKVEIYYKGKEKIHPQSKQKIYASLYLKEADIEIASSAEVFGNIFSGGKSFKVTGTGSVQPFLYFAPNAHFEVSGSGTINGLVIGNSISVHGQGGVNSRSLLLTEGSLSIGGNELGEVIIDKRKYIEK